MTFNELLKSCSTGKMPMVKSLVDIKFAKSNIGVVTTIKENSRHRGVGVTFEGTDFEMWFHDSINNDKRSKYMSQLELVEN